MIPLIKSTFFNEKETKKKLVKFVNDAKQLSMGSQCAEFEKAFSKWHGRKYSVFVSSGSMANIILIQSLMNMGLLKKGQRVGLSSLTWATNVMPIIQLGLVPVIIDCDLKTLNVTSKQLMPFIDDIDALFLTNVLGFSGDLDVIEKICKKKGIVFIEDNCESLGSKTKNRLLGNFGLASTFSFFVGHHMSTIEGGMICTDDSDLYSMLQMVRAHGWDRNISDKERVKLRQENNVDEFYSRYTFYELAYNGRPTEINGFIGNAQLSYLNKIVSVREKNFKEFEKVMSSNNHLVHLELQHMDKISNFAVPVICKTNELYKIYRQRFIDNKIEIRPIVAGDISKQPFFKKYLGGAKTKAKNENSNFVHMNGFYFGNNPELNQKERSLISKLLRQ